MLTRPNFRFSIFSLFLLITLAAVSGSHWLTSWELHDIRSQAIERKRMIRELSHRLGELVEEDLPFVQIRRQLNERSWEDSLSGKKDHDVHWYLHIPNHKRWRLCWAIGNVPLCVVPSGAVGLKWTPFFGPRG